MTVETGKEIRKRIVKALAEFKIVWGSKEISVRTKLNIFKTCIFSILPYASESVASPAMGHVPPQDLAQGLSCKWRK